MFTTNSGSATSGRSLTLSLLKASKPSAIRPKMITTVATGRRTLKFDKNMAQPSRTV